MKKMWMIAFVLLTSCATQNNTSMKAGDADEQLVSQGAKLIANGSLQAAITDYLDPVINRCEILQKNSKEKIFAARTSVESLYYMVLASAAGTNAKAIAPTCAEAIYFKAYANIDLGKVDEALNLFNQALDWSPVNSKYLSELGNIYQVKKDWPNALAKFSDAEEYASIYSPESVKNTELARAKRGVGFSLIELGKLDDAEKKFRECLEINKDDKNALNELEYIQKIKNKSM